MRVVGICSVRFVAFALSAIYGALSANNSLTGNKVLIVLPSITKKSNFSKFISQLQDRDYDVSIKANTDSDLKLLERGKLEYNHVIFLCPTCRRYGKGIDQMDISRFVKAGGNMVFSMGPSFSPLNDNISSEFGLSFQNLALVDHINYYNDTKAENPNLSSSSRNTIFTDNMYNTDHILTHFSQDSKKAQIFYNGIPHTIKRKSPLIANILSAPFSTYTIPESKISAHSNSESLASDSLSGSNAKLVTTIQARNNARAVFIGSPDMLSNDFFSINKKSQIYSNEHFSQDLTKWAFQETGVLKADNLHHHKKGETEQLPRYRIKDTITYGLDISIYDGGKWKPYKANDVQLEIRMIDPYIRTNLDPSVSKNSKTATTFSKEFMLPDKYGTFKFVVNYKRTGISSLLVENIIPIEPLRHDQFPRFLTQAYPYYTSSLLLLSGFVIICYMFIFSSKFNQTPSTQASSSSPSSKGKSHSGKKDKSN
ncbi:Dolichyl-diphosphooligosaccharide-protein glycosyltransferase 48 kDa subunit [Smittium culicis]|uniref:Dolichyl-diphosphooligosaccharide--protein glycosyltransferase subunit WBP1 n=2 Tax=Smittium culicis TaxID=133412 RepID=A0A1R1YQ30_9FUNG|nr:Dolichyl-diphosphooligosaccharide-protein glycosyltransferase 48 kDa subunit [Smittium culicis]